MSLSHRRAAEDFSTREPRALRRHRAGLDGWLRRQVRRQRRMVTLEDALLGGRASAYALYRLRFFMLRCLCAAALHVLRLSLLRFVFSHQAFLLTLVLHAVASCAGSLWWGALEVLRERVRRLSRDAEARRIPGEIDRWLTVAIVLAIGCLLLPATWVGWNLAGGGSRFSVLHFYVLVIGVRLGLDLVTLTFHSGIYAVRRVYRPLLAMVGVELAGFAAVLALWSPLGPWSFPIATLLSGVLSAFFVLHYCARLYRLFGWLPLRLGRPALSLSTGWRTIGECAAGGVAYALLKMDAFLMLAVFRWHAGSPRDVTLFMLFVSIGPAVQAGFDWAQLLYFDLKRLGGPCVAGLRRRYETLAVRLAWLVGLALWGLACALATAVMWRNLGELYWVLAPFVVGRSLLAQAQIRAFAKRRYGVLLSSGALFLAVIMALQVGVATDRSRLLGLATASFVMAVLLRRLQQRVEVDSDVAHVLPVTEWLQRLGEVHEPVRVRSLRFARVADPLAAGAHSLRDWAAENHWRHARMARRIAKQLRGRGAAAIIHPGRVVWYETPPVPASIAAKGLLRWGGGLVETVKQSPFERNGAAALRAAQDRDVLGNLLACAPSTIDAPFHPDQVERAFLAMIPRGTVCGPNHDTPPLLRAISCQERRSIFAEAVHFANHLHRSPRRRRFDVTSLISSGELKLIFIVDRKCDRRLRIRWRNAIRAWNVAAAIGDATPRQRSYLD